MSIDARVLNARLEFCRRTRAELAAAIEAKGQHCTEETIKEALCKDTRPYLKVVNAECEIITARWVKARVEELQAEVGAQLEALGQKADDVEVLFYTGPGVPVLADGMYIGCYDPDAHRLTP